MRNVYYVLMLSSLMVSVTFYNVWHSSLVPTLKGYKNQLTNTKKDLENYTYVVQLFLE